MRPLTSWKDIAGYLGRTTRTVQRWEKSLSLPIHRKGARSSGIVYAFQEEIDEWLVKTGGQPDSPSLSIRNGRLDALIEALPHVAWIADVNGLVEYANQRWNDYTGQSVVNPFPAGMEDAIHPDDLPAVRRVWKVTVATGETFEATYRLRAKDGQYRWFLTRANLYRGKENCFVRWIGICTDIHTYQEVLMTLKRGAVSFILLAMSSYVVVPLCG
jgi:PAS domain S-box-containing protein